MSNFNHIHTITQGLNLPPFPPLLDSFPPLILTPFPILLLTPFFPSILTLSPLFTYFVKGKSNTACTLLYTDLDYLYNHPEFVWDYISQYL